MYTQLLASWSIELDIVSKYYATRFYVKARKQETRREKDLDLTAIPSTVKQVKESRETHTKLKTSIANTIPLL
jgi:predicted GNAT superfamily acetyltransferase